MKRFDPRIVFGFLMMAGGGFALAQQMGYLENASDVIWGGLMIAVGVVFLSLVVGGHWWAVFPGFTLLAIGAVTLLPASLNDLGGALFLGGIALSFWVAYITAPQDRWWALIPAGVLSTLAGVTLVSEKVGEFQTGGFFFLGLALTFLLVALLARMRWAYWPALVLGILGMLSMAALFDFVNYIWSAAFIAGGGYLLFKYFTNR